MISWPASIEITGADSEALAEVAPSLAPGSRVNVTHLANETSQQRLAAVRAVLQCGLTPVAHLAARRFEDQGQLAHYLEGLAALGAQREVFVIAGDPERSLGPYSDALDLLQGTNLARHGIESVGISGYPEGHPHISAEELWASLAQKVAYLAEQGLQASISTQMNFDAHRVAEWIRHLRERGISVPIRVGVPGPAGVKRLLSFAKRFGIASSAGIARKYGFSLTNLMSTAGPDRFVAQLDSALREFSAGDVSLHFYTFGGLRATAEWINAQAISADRLL